MRRGRRSARTLSTMLATSDGFSVGGAVSCAVCSAPAATAMAADAVGALNSQCSGSAGTGLASLVSRIWRQLAQAAAVLLTVSDSSLGFSLCSSEGSLPASCAKLLLEGDISAIAGSEPGTGGNSEAGPVSVELTGSDASSGFGSADPGDDSAGGCTEATSGASKAASGCGIDTLDSGPPAGAASTIESVAGAPDCGSDSGASAGMTC